MNETAQMKQARRHQGPLPSDPNSQISTKLRQYYDQVQEQEIPRRFLDLLEKLDEAESMAKTRHDDDEGKEGGNGGH
jgi:hypothetical protein